MPDADSRDVGSRIRELREVSDVTVEEMAERLRVSPEKYRRFESGDEGISASDLNLVAGRLGVDLGLLLTGEAPRMKTYAVTRHGKGPAVDRRRGYRYENLAAHFRGARFEPFVVRLDPLPDDAPIPQNTHAGQEFNYLLEGRMAVSVRGNASVLEPGDSIIFDANEPHGMKALDDRPATFLAMITP